jgi:hypothetical protein
MISSVGPLSVVQSLPLLFTLALTQKTGCFQVSALGPMARSFPRIEYIRQLIAKWETGLVKPTRVKLRHFYDNPIWIMTKDTGNNIFHYHSI